MADAIKVAVRMRPLNKRERSDKDYPGMASCEMFQKDATCVVTDPAGDPKNKATSKNFTFDYTFDSSCPEKADCATQSQVYAALCEPLVKHVCNSDAGGNACLFAYGLTGTGKTFTMMGAGPTQMSQGTSSADEGRDKGLIPRSVENLFELKSDLKFTVSYLELYNGSLRDLLLPPPPSDKLKAELPPDLPVHTHPKFGVYVDGLSESVADDLNTALKLLDFGTKMRTVASTNMNSTSSRSHAIFQMKVHFPDEGSGEGYVPTRLNLVDLAGRENEKNTAASGERLRELSFINASLFELANCIHALSTKSKSIPFRNNKLTLMLSDCLQPPKDSGHAGCKTSMLAAITPAASSYADTMATLRFAAAAKTIKTKTPLAGQAGMTARQKDTLIKQLQAELSSLKDQMASSDVAGDSAKLEELTSKVELTQKMAEDYKKKFEEIEADTKKQNEERERALSDLGMQYSGDTKNATGTHTTTTGLAALTGDSRFPLLVNLSDDDYLKASVVYQLKFGQCSAGSDGNKDSVYLTGLGITASMAVFSAEEKGGVFLSANDSGEDENRVLVNGKRIKKSDGKVMLKNNDRVLFGHALAFLLIIPADAKKLKSAASMAELDEKLSLSAAKEEVTDEGGQQFSILSGYLEIFSKAKGATAAAALRQKLHKACPLVDEANAITKELRPKDCLKFKLALLDGSIESGSTLETVVPEVVVRLIHSPEMRKNWRSAAVAAKFNHHKVFGLANEVMAWMHIDKQPHDNFSSESAPTDAMKDVCLHVWTWDKFLLRVESMRDVYDKFHRGKLGKSKSSSDIEMQTKVEEYLHENPAKDAWREFGPDHVGVLSGHKGELENRCTSLTSENTELKSQVADLKKQLRTINQDAAKKRLLEVEKDVAALDSVAEAIKQALVAKS